MSSWNWSFGRMSWHEHLAFSLAFIVWIEGPGFYSEVTRWIAVGLSIAALLTMLVGRRGWPAVLCAGLALSSWRMVPASIDGFRAMSTHLVALLMFAAPILMWFHERKGRRDSKPVHP